MTEKCPNCGAGAFEAQNVVIKFPDVLRQWEVETATRFSAATYDEYKDIKSTTLYKCGSCTFGAFSPAAAGTANFYREITTEGDYYVFEKWEFKKALSFVDHKKAKSLLDYGCGGGAFLKQVKARFSDMSIAGFDMNPLAAEIFKGTGISFSHDLDSHANTYDLVTAFQIIEHLEDPYAALKKINAKLNAGGYVIISVPNADGPIRHFPYALTEVPPHHVNRWTAKSLHTYLNNAGFDVVETSYEPLSRILWDGYLPAIAKALFPRSLHAAFDKLRFGGIVRRLSSLLKITPLKSLPLKGHSVYVVARKCAG